MIASLTKLYLEKMSDELIEEEDNHTVVELRSWKRLAGFNEPALTLNMSNSTLLKAGLKNWKQKSKSVDIIRLREMEE